MQVGDPFLEKLLLEACLEAMATGAIVGIQDMGAAGLTSTSCEMASRGGVGIEIDLTRVPQRETGMTPYEMMLSESQERMLLVAERGREQEVFAVFRKWGLDAVEIGRVTSDGLLRVVHHGQVAASIPAAALADEAPAYRRPIAPPSPLANGGASAAVAIKTRAALAGAGTDLTEHFRQLLAAPAIASKRWIFEQYDHMVRTNTVVLPGAADAAVVRLKGTRRALALSTDGNGRWCALDPRTGAMHAVAEAARNVAAVGARPWAATNCLNFGSPEKPDVMWQFSEAVDGIAEACSALAIPITGGNVSFYNDTLGKSIDPTPILGVLGLLEDASRAMTMGFRAEGDVILLLDGRGDAAPGGAKTAASEESSLHEFSSSEYIRTITGVSGGIPPAIDLAAESRLIDALVALASDASLTAAHDLSDGGLAVALAECGFASEGLAADVSTESPYPPELALFGEAGARAVVTTSETSLAQVRAHAAKYGVAARVIGRVTRAHFQVRYNGVTVIRDASPALRSIWTSALQHALAGRAPGRTPMGSADLARAVLGENASN